MSRCLSLPIVGTHLEHLCHEVYDIHNVCTWRLNYAMQQRHHDIRELGVLWVIKDIENRDGVIVLIILARLLGEEQSNL